MIVGVAGALRAGKDTIAAYLTREHGFTKLAWADQLRHEISRVVFRRTLKQMIRDYDSTVEGGWVKDVWRLAVENDEAWWDKRLDRAMAEKKPEALRPFLQEFGTEDRRTKIDDDYWLKAWYFAAAKHPQGTDFVIPDTRFQNEAECIRAMKGVLIKVVRSGYNGDGHKSERDLDGWTDWDAVFVNDGTIEELEGQVSAWLVKHTGLVGAL